MNTQKAMEDAVRKIDELVEYIKVNCKECVTMNELLKTALEARNELAVILNQKGCDK